MPYSFEFAPRHLVHGDHDFREIILDFQKVAEFSAFTIAYLE